jgi:hypothetical protein
MNPFPRSLAWLAAALVTALLSACATGMGKDECVAADWRTIGYEDGVRGFPADRIGAHRVACAKHQVTPDLVAYMEGRDRGLVEYCQPRNGYRVGLNGGGYANVCPAVTEAGFLNGYQWGRQIHDARAELRSTQARLRSGRDGIAHTDNAIASATAELLMQNLPKDRRLFLAQELVRLGQERTALAVRIDELTVRAQQLALNVQQLERQSPYAL